MPHRRQNEYSLRQTAKLHGISPGYLSKRIREDKPAKGFDLTPFVRLGDDGGVECFVFPQSYEFPVVEESETVRENPLPPSGDGVAGPEALDWSDLRTARREGERVQNDSASEVDTATGIGSVAGSVAASTLTGFVREEPEQAVVTVLEGVKLVGAPLLAIGAGKYLYDTVRAAQPTTSVRANPEGPTDDAGASPGFWSVVGISAVVFVGADYTVHRDESLLVRGAQWLGQRFDRFWENADPSGSDARVTSAADPDTASPTPDRPNLNAWGQDRRLGSHRQQRDREGQPFDRWQPHSGDGAASPGSQVPTAARPSSSPKTLNGPL